MQTEWAGRKYTVTYRCDVCDQEFDSAAQRNGHKVGKHRKHRKGGRPQLPIRHGTIAGYQAELRRGIPRCEQCKLARTDYVLFKRREKNKESEVFNQSLDVLGD